MRQGFRRIPGKEEDRRCWNCQKPLTGRQTRYCSEGCSTAYWANFSWGHLRSFVFRRDNWTCRLCGYRKEYGWHILEADHIIPIADGGAEFEKENVRTLCEPCHKHITAEWHRRKAEIRSDGHMKQLPLPVSGPVIPKEQLPLPLVLTPPDC